MASSPFRYSNSISRAVVEKFGGSFAIDLVAFLAAGPMETDRVEGVFDFEAGLQGAEGDFAAQRALNLTVPRQPRSSVRATVSRRSMRVLPKERI
jgi:hypothetical protein